MTRRSWPAVAGLIGLCALGAATPILSQEEIARSRTRIEAVSKTVSGGQVIERQVLAACPGGIRTRKVLFGVRAEMTAFECDERCSREKLNGIFRASAIVTRRENPELNLPNRGHFEGRWGLFNNAGQLLAQGHWRGTVTAGTHNGPHSDTQCERCAPPGHFEGLLEGTSLVRECRGPILASISGTGLDPRLDRLTMRVEGSLTLPCENETPIGNRR